MCDIMPKRAPLIEAVRVLVVEDDKDIAELVAHHLGRAGYATACLHSGSAVLDGLHDDPPDLLVLDLMLPGLSGLEICRAVRAEPRLASLPIIMLTAKSEEADRNRGARARRRRLCDQAVQSEGARGTPSVQRSSRVSRYVRSARKARPRWLTDAFSAGETSARVRPYGG